MAFTTLVTAVFSISSFTLSATFKVTAFQSHIDHPVLIDRATFSLHTSDQPLLTHGVEILGRVRHAPYSASASYTYLKATEEGGREVALTPKHAIKAIAMREIGDGGRVGVQMSFTGEQRLDGNPYRTTSEPYTVITIFAERWIGKFSVFANAENAVFL